MGFAAQLAEILHALPPARQTLLFSATLPKSLVEFARAGLQEPHLVRLDSESKISPDLESAFFTIKVYSCRSHAFFLLLRCVSWNSYYLGTCLEDRRLDGPELLTPDLEPG